MKYEQMSANDYRYQDDWLKTSANSLQLWEKAPLEPYALPKPVRFLTWLAVAKLKITFSLSVDVISEVAFCY